jgi:uncharacterized protein YjbJ (UPF0337 family)
MKKWSKNSAEGKMHQVKSNIGETVGNLIKESDLATEGKNENMDKKAHKKSRPARENYEHIEGMKK